MQRVLAITLCAVLVIVTVAVMSASGGQEVAQHAPLGEQIVKATLTDAQKKPGSQMVRSVVDGAGPGREAGLSAAGSGDVNCDGRVDAIDAALVLQFIAGLFSPFGCPDAADVDFSGGTNAIDAALIL